MKGFLDDPPTLRHPEKGKKIRHVNSGTGQSSRPVCDFESNNRNRLDDVHAYDARCNIRRWSVSINPVEQEWGANSELTAGITKERGCRVEGWAHHVALALLAAVDIEL